LSAPAPNGQPAGLAGQVQALVAVPLNQHLGLVFDTVQALLHGEPSRCWRHVRKHGDRAGLQCQPFFNRIELARVVSECSDFVNPRVPLGDRNDPKELRLDDGR